LEREEVAGGWRISYTEEFHNLYSSSCIWVIKSRTMRQVGHIAYKVEMKNAYKILLKKPDRKGTTQSTYAEMGGYRV
jgi:hypothetical protein